MFGGFVQGRNLTTCNYILYTLLLYTLLLCTVVNILNTPFMGKQLKLATYNCTGFGPGKPEYISRLIELHDFVLIQEHWLHVSQFHRIKNIPVEGAKILSHDVSAIYDNIFTQGRGFGGCSIIWKSIVNAEITPSLLSSTRLCAVKVKMDSCTFILFSFQFVPLYVSMGGNN